jgi:hypothetical protein
MRLDGAYCVAVKSPAATAASFGDNEPNAHLNAITKLAYLLNLSLSSVFFSPKQAF